MKKINGFILSINKKIVFCAHGSNSKLFQIGFDKFFTQAKNFFRDYECYKCFIEKNYPSIDACLSKLNYSNDVVNFVPVLIFTGNHFLTDIKKKLIKFNKINIHETINLNKNILKIFENKLCKKLKSKKRILVCIFSKSKKKLVYENSKKYTKELAKLLMCQSFLSIDNTEKAIALDRLNDHKEKKMTELIVHPIFLFDGFLYQSVLVGFQQLEFKNITITKPFLDEKGILENVMKKINQNLV